jgi:hypothetical protein
MQSSENKFSFLNRDREKCKKCDYYNYLNCQYVTADGFCSLTGIKVTIKTNVR